MKLEEISKIIAKDIGLSDLEIDRINRVQWKFLADTIQSGSFAPVEIFYLGKFYRNERYSNNKINRDISRLV